MSKKSIYNKLNILKKDKAELLKILGAGDNYYHLDEWSYFLGKNFFGGEKYLIIDFNRDIAVRVYKRTIF